MANKKATTQITRLIFFNAYLPNVPVPHSRFGAYNICKKLCLAEIQRASISQVQYKKKFHQMCNINFERCNYFLSIQVKFIERVAYQISSDHNIFYLIYCIIMDGGAQVSYQPCTSLCFSYAFMDRNYR